MESENAELGRSQFDGAQLELEGEAVPGRNGQASLWVSFDDEAAARLHENVYHGSDRKGNRKTASDFGCLQGNQQRCDGILDDALRQLCSQRALSCSLISPGGCRRRATFLLAS